MLHVVCAFRSQTARVNAIFPCRIDLEVYERETQSIKLSEIHGILCQGSIIAADDDTPQGDSRE